MPDLGAGRLLELTWDAEQIFLSRDDVLRFAAGVQVVTRRPGGHLSRRTAAVSWSTCSASSAAAKW